MLFSFTNLRFSLNPHSSKFIFWHVKIIKIYWLAKLGLGFFSVWFDFFEVDAYSSCMWNFCFTVPWNFWALVFEVSLLFETFKPVCASLGSAATSPHKPRSCCACESLLPFQAYFLLQLLFGIILLCHWLTGPLGLSSFIAYSWQLQKILASFFNHEMNCCRNGECYSFLHITFFNQKIVISQMH